MAIINSYTTVTPKAEDLLLISDVSVEGNPTRTVTINSVLALGAGGGGGSISNITSSNSNFLSVTNPTGPIVVLELNTGPVQSGGNSLATTGDIFTFTNTSITNAINNLGTIGTVTNFAVDSTAIAAFTTSVSNPTTTPILTIGITGGSAGQYLDYQGNWSTPGGTGAMTSWRLTGDGGAISNVVDNDLVTFAGGTKITTSAALSDTLTITHDATTTTPTTSSSSPGASGTFDAIDTITYDSTGHITGFNTNTVTLPAAGGGGGSGTVTSVGLDVTSVAFLSSTPAFVTSSGTFTVTASGTSSQYVKGDGSLGDIADIAGTYTFNIQGDSGGPTAISSGDTIDIEGGTNITTSLTGNTLTINGPSALGTVTSVGSSNSNFISGGVTGGAGADPITTTGNLEYSLRAIGTPDATKFLRGDGNGVWSKLTNGSGIAAISNSTTSPTYETTIQVEYVGSRNIIESANTPAPSLDLADTIIINDTSGGDKVFKATLQETQDLLANSLVPINFSINVSATGTPVFKNQGNVTSDTQDFGGTLSDWTFANNSTSAKIVCRVNFAGRTDTDTDYMVNIIFESSTEDQNGNEVPAIGYVENKNANYFDFVLLPAGLTGKAAGSNMRVNFQIYK